MDNFRPRRIFRKPARPAPPTPPAQRPPAVLNRPVPQQASHRHPPAGKQNRANEIAGAAVAAFALLMLLVFFVPRMSVSEEAPQKQQERHTTVILPTPRPLAPQPIPLPAPVPQQQYVNVPQTTIDMVMKRNVYINVCCDKKGMGYSGSGARIGNGMVLTAWHVVGDSVDEKMSLTVNGHPSQVLAFYRGDYDMAVVRVQDSVYADPLEFRYDPDILKLNTPVVIAGNPERRQNVFQTGIISSLLDNEEMFEVSTFTAMPGLSGSLVYTTEGVCIGMVQKKRGDTNQVALVHNLRPVSRLLEAAYK